MSALSCTLCTGVSISWEGSCIAAVPATLTTQSPPPRPQHCHWTTPEATANGLPVVSRAAAGCASPAARTAADTASLCDWGAAVAAAAVCEAETGRLGAWANFACALPPPPPDLAFSPAAPMKREGTAFANLLN